jgi:glycine dehydrogenase subunit 1
MDAREFTSPYSPNTDADRKAMLDAIGVKSAAELFKDIPARYRNPALNLPPPLSELELRREIESMARQNAVPGEYACFLGAGSYRHYIPAVVRQIASRGEFMTSYTPYQPEVAQGTLQATYEFQTLVCQLTGMEAANAGMYDGSTSLAEAALMAARITKFDRIAVLDTVSPFYRDVLQTYLQAPGLKTDVVNTGRKIPLSPPLQKGETISPPFVKGDSGGGTGTRQATRDTLPTISPPFAKGDSGGGTGTRQATRDTLPTISPPYAKGDSGGFELEEGTACLLVQQPNFFGYLEDLSELAERAHSQNALLVVYSDPISLGMFKPPGEYGADIVVAEGQSLGVPASFGGPYVGIFACKEQYLRQMPGRIVGKTADTRGRTGYVLTLQTREQHIRRERATSNICTSVALIALMATAAMAALGKQGMRRIAELCYHKAHYAASLIDRIPGYSLPVEGTFFREFVARCPLPPAEVNRRLLDYKIIGGLDVSAQIPNGMLLCVTEMNTREEIEALASALAEIR